MNEPPVRRGVVVLAVAAILAMVLMLLGHRALEGYLEKQRERRGAAVVEPADAGRVSGRVTFADGAPAAAARVRVTWRDAAGRPGTTRALTGPDGNFAPGNVPANADVDEVAASVGPLAAKVALPTAPGVAVGAHLAIELPREFRLAGLVRSRADRAPVAGAVVEVGGVRSVCGQDGDFRVEHIAAAVLREARPLVRVSAAGFASLEWPLPTDDLPETYGDLTILLEPSK